MWSLYIIRTLNRRRSYVGVTVNLKRRLRQHNGQIKGGAKATRGRGPWSIIATITGLPSKRVAMQLEWALHNVRRLSRSIPRPPRRISPCRRRIHNLLMAVLPRKRWTSKSPYCLPGLTLTWWCYSDRPVFCGKRGPVTLLRDLPHPSLWPQWLKIFLVTKSNNY